MRASAPCAAARWAPATSPAAANAARPLRGSQRAPRGSSLSAATAARCRSTIATPRGRRRRGSPPRRAGRNGALASGVGHRREDAVADVVRARRRPRPSPPTARARASAGCPPDAPPRRRERARSSRRRRRRRRPRTRRPRRRGAARRGPALPRCGTARRRRGARAAAVPDPLERRGAELEDASRRLPRPTWSWSSRNAGSAASVEQLERESPRPARARPADRLDAGSGGGQVAVRHPAADCRDEVADGGPERVVGHGGDAPPRAAPRPRSARPERGDDARPDRRVGTRLRVCRRRAPRRVPRRRLPRPPRSRPSARSRRPSRRGRRGRPAAARQPQRRESVSSSSLSSAFARSMNCGQSCVTP